MSKRMALRYDRDKRNERYNRFLKGFKIGHLRIIVHYYNLSCADYWQERCLRKSIRESGLTIKQIWRALING